MIICKNCNWKLNKWFSIVEIVVSVSILAIISIWVFNIYKVIQNQNTFLTDKVLTLYFWDYLSTIIRETKILDNYNIIWTPFYLIKEINWDVKYTLNPIFNNTAWGFYYWLLDENERSFFHEIFFVWFSELNWLTYNHYKVNISYNWNKNSFYITK